MKEMAGLTDPPGMLDYALAVLDRLLWYAPPRVKQWLNPGGFHLYDHRSGRWL